MRLVPSVFMAALRRAVSIGGPSDQLLLTGSKISTSFDGVGNCPPNTHICPFKFTARVLLVGRGISVIVVMESAAGSYLNEFVVSVRAPPVISAPPPV
jgi:hypothetical protein